ncbi:MAG: PilZ domain-containing protein [Nitrospiraceae bacterium]
MEGRKSQGFPVRWLVSFLISPIACKDGRISGSGMASNLAVGGCTVVSDTRVYPGVQMELRLYLPEDVMPLDVDRAVVRWTKGRKFRLEFISMQSEAQERLHRLVDTRD